MASTRYYQNGAGGATGADLAVLRPTFSASNYWYVGNAVTGASDGNAGTERAKPLLTTAQAFSNAAANDTIVFLQNHAETIASNLNVTKSGLSFVGEGTGSSRPRFTCGVSAGVMWTLNATGILFDNLYFPASTAAGSSRISLLVSPLVVMRNLQFDCGANDTVGAVVAASAGVVTLSGCGFTSVAATPAIGYHNNGANNDLVMDSVTFDGGAFGWSDYAFKESFAVARLRATRISQLNGSHAVMVTGTGGVWNQQAATGDSRVDWTP